ncbi:cell division protein FtsA [candidate division WWE3 bacterium RIFCSPHIGHO2_01_FULL_42_13]|uniref:Cell division protein FtsA n=1 Tax=candidate division WWE3 bacterium RIFCSPHIGHO2_01_FULL_42_13 TaxID=1802617 RepID=A0A1F4UQD8_UNCKA|nr:MAG: cell division protein FtsA [candidate division WWE3 bacterium RIFCSPHIGHO2_01_FULL_42_13]
MSKEKIITAIDIGSSKISTIIAALTDNKISVIGVSGNVPSQGIKKGNVVDIDDAVQAISNSLERAERMAGVSVSSAFVTINGSHLETLNSHGVVAVSHQGAEITNEDVARVTEAAQAVSLPSTREIIHVIPRDFMVDGQDGIRDPIGMSGIRLEVETNIIHGSATAMRNLAKCVEQVGVEVEDMVYVGVASAEAVLTDTEKDLGCLLVDVGGGTTSVIAFHEGSPVYSDVLPIGGKHITSDLAIGLRAHMEASESIKIKLSEERESLSPLERDMNSEDLDVSGFGLDMEKVPKKLLYGIIDARLNEIFSLIALEIKKADLQGKLPAGLILTGGASLTSGIERIAKYVLKAPVRIGYPKGVTGLIDEIEGPAFAATVGEVIYGSRLIRSGSLLSFEAGRGKIGNILSRLLEKAKSFLP